MMPVPCCRRSSGAHGRCSTPRSSRRATREALRKLSPVTLWKNPVIFVVEIGAALTTLFVARDIAGREPGVVFGVQISLWLWFTVLFANFAEAMAEARGKAQAESLRKTKTEVMAKRERQGGAIESGAGLEPARR